MNRQFSILSAVLLLSLAGSLVYLLSLEISAYFRDALGKPATLAAIWAWSIALLIPACVAFWRGPSLSKWLFISALVVGQIYAASYQATTPMRGADESVIAAIDSQIAVIDAGIDKYSADKWKKKHDDLKAERAKWVERKLEAQKSKADAWDVGAVWQIVAMRGLLEIGLIVLVHLAMCQLEFAEIRKNRTIDDHFVDADKMVADSPIDIVKSRHPAAVCKAANGRRGPFTVYADTSLKTRLASATNKDAAWEEAARKVG